MLERIKKKVNSRGIFNISRIVPSGSGTEKTTILKFSDSDPYLELDFLAVFKNTIKQCKEQILLQHCEGCITIVNPPVEFEPLRQLYNREDEFSAETTKERHVISDLFLNEINQCLTSSCECLSIQCDKDRIGNYTIFIPTVVHRE